MSTFANALQNYRTALVAALGEVPANQRGMFELLIDSASDIERRYTQTSDPNMCRILVEGEGQVLGASFFSGPKVDEVRNAYAALLHTVRPK
jgi:hypothetical protein